MPYDFKKEQKEFYQPKTIPALVDVPVMTYLMIDGSGDPNSSPEYAQAVQALYALAYAIRMNKTWEGYFEYVVPPLEGLWDAGEAFRSGDILDKQSLNWTSLIRQPDFVTQAVFEEAKKILAAKKPGIDASRVRLEALTEGPCVQILHVGPYDTEPSSIARMEDFARQAGWEPDFSGGRRHHEIYLSDPQKTEQDKLKTVIRHPVKKRD